MENGKIVVKRGEKYRIIFGGVLEDATVTSIWQGPDGVVEVSYHLGWRRLWYRRRERLGEFLQRQMRQVDFVRR